MRLKLLLAPGLAAVLAWQGATAVAARRKEEKKKETEAELEIDYLDLAAKMFKDGHLDRAEANLRQVDLARPDVDVARFHLIYGLVHLKRQAYEEAKTSFRRSIEAGQKERSVYLFLAQALFGLKDWNGTVKALDQAGDALTGSPEVYVMRANAHWNAGQNAEALAVLRGGFRRFPSAALLKKMQIFFLVDLGLYQAAVTEGLEYLEREEVGADDFVAVGEALKRAGQVDKALDILERARLRFPFDVNLTVQLAHLYMAKEHPNAAADLFNQAAMLDEKYSLEAAELYRKSGRLDLALAKNAVVADQEKKMKQRLSILLKMERFELITAMEPRLSRLGLLSSQDLRYALAYAYYSSGDFADAERHLKELRDAQLFEKATALRKAMAQCKDAGWECF